MRDTAPSQGSKPFWQRKKLADLRSKMDGNEKLETMLEDIIANADKQKTLSEQLGIDAGQEG